jgi:hypothetical protein
VSTDIHDVNFLYVCCIFDNAVSRPDCVTLCEWLMMNHGMPPVYNVGSTTGHPHTVCIDVCACHHFSSSVCTLLVLARW